MMPIPKKYLHDKLVLLLLSANVFLAFLCAALIFLRLNIGQGAEGYIVEYRSNLGISAFRVGGVSGLLSFAGFAVLMAIASIAISVRTYRIRRELALAMLAAGILLLILAVIVSNALMILH
jgi:hypothetical protein